MKNRIQKEQLNIKELDTLPPVQPLIKDLNLYAGTLNILCGTGQSGKTLFAQYLAICVSSGEDVLEMETRKGSVVYCDYELGDNQAKRRYLRIMSGLGLDCLDLDRNVDKFRMKGNMTADEETELLNYFISICKNHTLLIIDSLRASTTADENNGEMEPILKIMKRAADETNCCILLIHHKGKGGGGVKQSGRGSSTIYDSCDYQIDLDYIEKNASVEITAKKTRDGKPFEPIIYQMRDVGDYMENLNATRSLVFVRVNEEEAMDRVILTYLLENGDANKNQICKNIKSAKAKVLKTIGGLEARGFINFKQEGKSIVCSITAKGINEVQQ